ncbi:hypothetical protein, partial [Streptococcus minor]|uniref:hypothetical protein n=1 Tax=Streptococcus minor TaxID=229549 RepID=UPI00163A83ED
PASYYAAFGPHAAVYRPSPSYVGGYYGGGSTGQYAAYQQQQAQARAIAQRQQNIRNAYAQATGIKGTPRSKEAKNMYLNWGKALAETLKHVCNPKTAKANGKTSKSSPNKVTLMSALVASGSATLLFLGTDKKKFSLFGKTEQTIDISSPEWKNKNWLYNSYLKHSVKTEKPGSGLIQGQFTNGVFSGVKLSVMDVVTGSLGMGDGNLNTNLSLSLFGYTIGANVGIGKDGITTSAGADNGKKGYDIGLNLNGDYKNGMIGAYITSRNISTATDGVVSTQATETGFRTGNGTQIITAGLVLTSPIWGPAVIGSTAGATATATAGATIVLIISSLFKSGK